jgi:hypothetical protein
MSDILAAALISRIETIGNGDRTHLPALKRSDMVRFGLGLVMLATVVAALITSTAAFSVVEDRGRLVTERPLHSFPPQKLAISPGIAYISPSSNNQESPQ